MKIRQICMVVLLWLGVIPAVQAQSFDKLWKEVEQAGKKSLPKTVIKLTDEIYRKGEKEKNSAQMLKAYMWRMKYQEIVTPDSFYVGLTGRESMLIMQPITNGSSGEGRKSWRKLLPQIYANGQQIYS